jgi:quinol monooxygenase YgiN
MIARPSLVFWLLLLMIHVIATIALQPGTREAFLTEFRKIVEPVRAEVGCIEYGPAIEIDTGLPTPPASADTVIVVEKWESLAALEAHLTAPHMNAYRPKVKDFVKHVGLQILQPV